MTVNLADTTHFSEWVSTLCSGTLLGGCSPVSGGQDFLWTESMMPPTHSVSQGQAGVTEQDAQRGAPSAIWVPGRNDPGVFTIRFMLEQRHAEDQVPSSPTLGTAHALPSPSLGTEQEMSSTSSGCSPGPGTNRPRGRCGQL